MEDLKKPPKDTIIKVHRKIKVLEFNNWVNSVTTMTDFPLPLECSHRHFGKTSCPQVVTASFLFELRTQYIALQPVTSTSQHKQKAVVLQFW